MTERGAFTLRRAVQEDYEAVRALNALDFRYHQNARPDYFRPDWGDYSRAEFQRLLAHPAPIAWVAEVQGQVVGFCLGTVGEVEGTAIRRPRRVAAVEDLAVLPAFRRQGIASALLEQARQQAKELGAQALELCVWGFNQEARRLYERLGLTAQYTRMECGL